MIVAGETEGEVLNVLRRQAGYTICVLLCWSRLWKLV
jgi:hypothetical protein